jgi:hypothetical protein
MEEQLWVEPVPDDLALEEVFSFFTQQLAARQADLDLETIFARCIRQAIDEVIDGRRTGRYSYDQLDRQEKAYIGTRVEIVLRTELGLEWGEKLDTRIAGHEVDIKWSSTGRWMIPTEAIGEICLVLAGDDSRDTFTAGLVRCRERWLSPGENRDKKRQLSKAGRLNIEWLVEDGRLPANFLNSLEEETLNEILTPSSGQARIRELFSRVRGRPVPRSAIETVARQKDAMRRVRQDASRPLGCRVLSGHYSKSRRAAEILGYGKLRRDEYLSVPEEEIHDLPRDLRDELGAD